MQAGTDNQGRRETVILTHGRHLLPEPGLRQPGDQHQQAAQGGTLEFAEAPGSKAQEQLVR